MVALCWFVLSGCGLADWNTPIRNAVSFPVPPSMKLVENSAYSPTGILVEDGKSIFLLGRGASVRSYSLSDFRPLKKENVFLGKILKGKESGQTIAVTDSQYQELRSKVKIGTPNMQLLGAVNAENPIFCLTPLGSLDKVIPAEFAFASIYLSQRGITANLCSPLQRGKWMNTGVSSLVWNGEECHFLALKKSQSKAWMLGIPRVFDPKTGRMKDDQTKPFSNLRNKRIPTSSSLNRILAFDYKNQRVVFLRNGKELWERELASGMESLIPALAHQNARIVSPFYFRGELVWSSGILTTSKSLQGLYRYDRTARKWSHMGSEFVVAQSASQRYLLLMNSSGMAKLVDFGSG